jgi:hypothetical protein
MRIDVSCRLVPEKYRLKTLSNLFLSQGQYLLNDRKLSSLRFFIASLVMHFTIKKIYLVAKSFAIIVRDYFQRKPVN